jgi:hypothetical protein
VKQFLTRTVDALLLSMTCVSTVGARTIMLREVRFGSHDAVLFKTGRSRSVSVGLGLSLLMGVEAVRAVRRKVRGFRGCGSGPGQAVSGERGPYVTRGRVDKISCEDNMQDNETIVYVRSAFGLYRELSKRLGIHDEAENAVSTLCEGR